jgi:catechol 2,3-dioxygenase-like lactoylglutathione lyase family enzyme
MQQAKIPDMNQRIVQISLLVDDYDRAIHWYTEVMRFHLLEDRVMSETKRWVRVGPQGGEAFSLLLAKAANEEQTLHIGNQTGGRVFLFIHTDDFDSYFKHLHSHQVEFISGPVTQPWGKVAVFKDLYGNLWDLIQPA